MIVSMAARERHSLDDRWQAFQSLDHLTEHWYWRPGWRVGRRFYTWHLTFGDAPALHALVDRVQADLPSDAVDLVPRAGLHLTMQGLGFTDEVADRDVDSIVAAAGAQLRAVAGFELSLGPVDPDAEGVGLLIDPWAPVERVRLAIRAAIGEVWGADGVPEPADGFRPHVTVAYSATDAPVDELRRVMAPLRDLPPAVVQVGQAQLIRLGRDDREYRWDVVASVPLGVDGLGS